MYYDAVTNSSGQWSVDYSADFASVDFVDPVAIHQAAAIGEEKWATLHAYSEASANGSVLESKTVVFGGEGAEYSEEGVLVRVRVEGTLS